MKRKKDKTKINDVVLRRIFPFITSKKITSKKAIEEFEEHFNLSSYLFKRLILPLLTFYLLFGLIFNTNVFDSIFLSLLIFIYSNFLPDVDIVFKKTNSKKTESIWYEKYLLLCLAPVVLYYTFLGKARSMYSKIERPFHTFQTVFIYGFFLLLLSSIFWTNTIERIFPPIFGMFGFSFHLITDKYYSRIKFMISKKSFFS